jgi:hypothetical protein
LQLYPSGETVKWPASLTVVPGPEDERSQSLAWALAAVIAGLVVVAGVAVLAWRRRPATPEER